jgi:predicted nucleic acid-binding protein
MIVLDTNVISEVTKPAPAAAVLAWLNDQPAETLYLSSVTLAEMSFGIATLPAGKRKNLLAQAFDKWIDLFAGRLLSFDEDAARRYAELALAARQNGRGLPLPDGYIAAIAASHGFIVASRDTSPFAACGVEVIDPWKVQG